MPRSSHVIKLTNNQLRNNLLDINLISLLYQITSYLLHSAEYTILSNRYYQVLANITAMEHRGHRISAAILSIEQMGSGLRDYVPAQQVLNELQELKTQLTQNSDNLAASYQEKRSLKFQLETKYFKIKKLKVALDYPGMHPNDDSCEELGKKRHKSTFRF